MEVVESPVGWVVTGEIDTRTCELLADAFADIARLSGRRIEVDLAGVSFIDSSGLRVLLELARRADEAGGSVQIRNPSRQVARLLAMTQLESAFGVEAGDPTTP